MDDNPKKMELKYETNPGTNYIASKMSETALSKIREAVASKVTETYTQTVFDQIAQSETACRKLPMDQQSLKMV